MKNQKTVKYGIYLPEDVSNLMKSYCKEANKSYSAFIAETIKLYFVAQKDKARHSVYAPDEQKLDIVLNTVKNLQDVIYRSYRGISYNSYLSNIGKDAGQKELARKKANNDFNKMLEGNEDLEDFMITPSVSQYVYETETEEKPKEDLFVMDDKPLEKHKITEYETKLFNAGVYNYDPDKYELPNGWHLDTNGQMIKD